MKNEFINATAIHLLELWALQHDFQPCGDWDEHDPNCLRDCSEHRIWTVAVRTPPRIDIDSLRDEFADFIQNCNGLPGVTVQFQPYSLEMYPYLCGDSSFLYIAVYQ